MGGETFDSWGTPTFGRTPRQSPNLAAGQSDPITGLPMDTNQIKANAADPAGGTPNLPGESGGMGAGTMSAIGIGSQLLGGYLGYRSQKKRAQAMMDETNRQAALSGQNRDAKQNIFMGALAQMDPGQGQALRQNSLQHRMRAGTGALAAGGAALGVSAPAQAQIGQAMYAPQRLAANQSAGNITQSRYGNTMANAAMQMHGIDQTEAFNQGIGQQQVSLAGAERGQDALARGLIGAGDIGVQAAINSTRAAQPSARDQEIAKVGQEDLSGMEIPAGTPNVQESATSMGAKIQEQANAFDLDQALGGYQAPQITAPAAPAAPAAIPAILPGADGSVPMFNPRSAQRRIPLQLPQATQTGMTFENGQILTPAQAAMYRAKKAQDNANSWLNWQ